MAKTKIKINKRTALSKIRATSRKWRQSCTGTGTKRRCPGWLKELAVSALGLGFSAGQVALATGVNRQSVLNWSKCARDTQDRIGPVELKLVTPTTDPDSHELVAGEVNDTDPVGEQSARGADRLVRIRFRTGAIMALELAQLDARIVNALNGDLP